VSNTPTKEKIMNPEVDAAWAVAPTVHEAGERLAHARAILTSRGPAPAPGQVSRALAEQVADMIRRGEPLPDDLGAQAINAQRAAELHQAEGDILRGVVTRLETDLDTIRRAQAPDALDYLRGRLADILDQARALLPHLGDVRDKAAAFDASPEAQTAWRKLTDLTEQYTAVREAQMTITIVAAPGSGIKGGIGAGMTYNAARKTGLAEMEGLPEVWNDVAETDLNGNSVTPPPWPGDADPRAGFYSPAYLAWLAENVDQARPWIPDPDQIGQAINRAARIRNQRLADRERKQAPRRAHALATGQADY
jgi:hypothetical protein